MTAGEPPTSRPTLMTKHVLATPPYLTLLACAGIGANVVLSFGTVGTEVLEYGERPCPVPKSGQLLVEVHAASSIPGTGGCARASTPSYTSACKRACAGARNPVAVPGIPEAAVRGRTSRCVRSRAQRLRAGCLSRGSGTGTDTESRRTPAV